MSGLHTALAVEVCRLQQCSVDRGARFSVIVARLSTGGARLKHSRNACVPTFICEFARILTLTDMTAGWTENASIRLTAGS